MVMNNQEPEHGPMVCRCGGRLVVYATAADVPSDAENLGVTDADGRWLVHAERAGHVPRPVARQ